MDCFLLEESVGRVAVIGGTAVDGAAPAQVPKSTLQGIFRMNDLSETARWIVLIRTDVQEIMPLPARIWDAAQADYKRLLASAVMTTVFSGDINITLWMDARQRQSRPYKAPPPKSPMSALQLNPVQVHLFGARAKLRAWFSADRAARRNVATGETASLGVPESTVSAGVRGWRAQGHAKAALSAKSC